MLANEWDSVQLAEWGLDVWENEDDKEPEAGLIDDDEIPEVKESKVKRGDIWQLGEHRIMCGDSTSSDDVAKLMNGEKADMVFTDPPYGMNLDTDYSKIKGSKKAKIKGGGKKYNKVIGDHNDFKPTLITTIYKNFGYCKEVFIWGADYFAEHIENRNDGSWIVWDKRGGEEADKIVGSCFELCWSKQKHKKDIARIKWMGAFGYADARNRVHPTQKPLALVEWFFKKWGKENDLITDVYLGSGSTLIIAEKLNRKCYGMELDEKYCDVIIERWEQFTGQKAIKNGTK
jgi:DNA modification methylase